MWAIWSDGAWSYTNGPYIDLHAPIAELAGHEGFAPSYMTRVLRLTLLAPDVVEAILCGQNPPVMTLALLSEPFPAIWTGQRTCSTKVNGPYWPLSLWCGALRSSHSGAT